MSAANDPISPALFCYVLGLADDQLVLGHRLSEWSGNAPTLEEELALANIALDLIGQARGLYQLAGAVEGRDRSEDDLAYFRDAREFLNVRLVECPNGDFADAIARQLFFATAMNLLWPALANSAEPRLAAIAAKAAKETAYHLRHATEWTLRLGDGTPTSHARMQAAVDRLWRFTGEVFETPPEIETLGPIAVDPAQLKPAWDAAIDNVLTQATLARPADGYMATGGRAGLHGEDLGHMLAVMQSVQRTHPGLEW